MIKKIFILSLLCFSFPFNALGNDDFFTDTEDGITSFKQDKESWRREEVRQEKKDTPKKEILLEIKQAIGNTAWKNIAQAEQIFCYEVSVLSDDYEGYTIDGMALTAFCGVIKDDIKQNVLSQLFMDDKNVLFNVREECMMQPRVVLRFVRGVDVTDVMLSAPCYSFAVYSPNGVKVFNARPAAQVIDAMVDTFEKNKTNFVSPALLNQLLPIGVPQTKEQKELVSEKEKAKGVWMTKKKKEETKEKEKKSQGWNNLDLGF